MPKYTRKLTPIVGDERRRKRACHDRTQTVMKKGDELAVLCPGTRVWVIVQNDEQTCIYSSEESFSLPVLSGNDVRDLIPCYERSFCANNMLRMS